MAVKVAKFGGSSVADVIQLRKIKEIIKSDPERRYIVVSAPGKRFEGDNKITDLLYLVKTTMENMLPFEQLLVVNIYELSLLAHRYEPYSEASVSELAAEKSAQSTKVELLAGKRKQTSALYSLKRRRRMESKDLFQILISQQPT